MRKKLIAIMIVLVMCIGAMAAIGPAVAAEPERNIASRVAESEPNDNFTQAQTISDGTTVNGDTGLTAQNPIDVFKFTATAGDIIQANCFLSNSAGFNDKVIHLELYDKWKEKKIAWSISGHVWESLTAVAKYTDTYYLMIIPWKGQTITYDMDLSVAVAPTLSDGQFVAPPSALSNMSNNPADWYRFPLNAGQTSNDVANATVAFNYDIAQFDLYIRDLMPESWTWWYNFSWWGEYFGGSGGLVEEAEAAASYSGDYFVDVQAWNGTATYTLSAKKKSAPSDGDNTPDDATLIQRQPGETQAKFNGEVDMAYDHYDWYKIHLKQGQSITATMFLQQPWSQAIYRIVTYKKEGAAYLPLSSWTNIKGQAVTGQAQAFVTDSPSDQDYFISVMAQVPLHPSNKSNLADWHLNNAHGKYQLVVDLPMDELHGPTLKTPGVSKVDVTEDTTSTSLKLNDVFDDADIGDPELQDALTYSTAGTYEHLIINVTNDAEGTVQIIPEGDWNGQTVVTFVATDRYGLQNETDIQIEVHGENDPPAVISSVSEILHDFMVKEGSVNQSNNNVVLVDKNNDPWSYKGFSDPDLMYGDVLEFEVTMNQSDNAYIPVELQDQNNYITLKYQGAKVYDPTGDTSSYLVPITIMATDSSGLSVTHTYNVTVDQNPPEITCMETIIYVDEGNATTKLLSDVCEASTGHKLSYEFLGGNSQNLTVKVDNQGNAKFTAIGDYFNVNGENLNFKAFMTQPWEKTVYFTLNVVIQNVNDPPTIYNMQPDPAIAINVPEGGYKDFSASVRDIDNSPLDMRYTWYIDNVAVASGANTFRYLPLYEDSGSHSVKMEVRDGSGGKADFTWNVNVDDTNRKPTARITTPQNNTQFDAGKPISFIAEATDPDGDPVTMIWMENGKEIERYSISNGTGIHDWSKKFKPGTTHVIQLVVQDDSGLESRYYLTIVIKPKKVDDGLPGFEMVVLIMAILVAMVVIVRRRDR